MYNWIEVKTRYTKIMDNGAAKQVTEAYLVDAMSCTEAEARIIEVLDPAENLSVLSATTTKITEVFDFVGEKYYKVKANFISLDATSGQERKTSSYSIAPADSLPEALRNYNAAMKGSTECIEIVSVCETKYVDVFFYTPRTK